MNTPTKEQLHQSEWVGLMVHDGRVLLASITHSDECRGLFDWEFTDCALVWRSPHATTSSGAKYAIGKHMERRGLSIDDLRWREGAEGAAGCANESVYFVRAGAYLKIGKAANVPSRVRSFECGCPYPIELLATIPGGVKVERKLHRQFSDLHYRGEWFKYEGALVEHVESLRARA